MVVFFLEVLSHPSLMRFDADVGLEECLFDFVGLKDNARRNAYLPSFGMSQVVSALFLDCGSFCSQLPVLALVRAPGVEVP